MRGSPISIEVFRSELPASVRRIRSDFASEIGAPAGAPFCLHVAEGVDAVAAGEVGELERRGLLNQWLLAVHGVGISR